MAGLLQHFHVPQESRAPGPTARTPSTAFAEETLNSPAARQPVRAAPGPRHSRLPAGRPAATRAQGRKSAPRRPTQPPARAATPAGDLGPWHRCGKGARQCRHQPQQARLLPPQGGLRAGPWRSQWAQVRNKRWRGAWRPGPGVPPLPLTPGPPAALRPEQATHLAAQRQAACAGPPPTSCPGYHVGHRDPCPLGAPGQSREGRRDQGVAQPGPQGAGPLEPEEGQWGRLSGPPWRLRDSWSTAGRPADPSRYVRPESPSWCCSRRTPQTPLSKLSTTDGCQCPGSGGPAQTSTGAGCRPRDTRTAPRGWALQAQMTEQGRGGGPFTVSTPARRHQGL